MPAAARDGQPARHGGQGTPGPKHEALRAYEPGYLHVDVKYLPRIVGESRRRYLFVAIDQATRWVFVRNSDAKSKSAANAKRFLRDLEQACSIRIRTILRDNGKGFTDRLFFGPRERGASSEHEFDQLCDPLGTAHHPGQARSPQADGMVERSDNRVEEVLQSQHFRSGEELGATLHRCTLLHNQEPPQPGAWTAERPCGRWRTGAGSGRICSRNGPTTYRDVKIGQG